MNQVWAVVTGASSGIGAAFARSLAARGHRVLAVARGSDGLVRIAEELRKAGGVVETMATDLLSAEGVAATCDKALALGDVELLVNNAGLSTSGRFLEQAAERELQSIRVKAWGPAGRRGGHSGPMVRGVKHRMRASRAGPGAKSW